MIKPIVAGYFYEEDFEKLSKQIEKCFTSKLGPGSLPGKRKNEKLFGVISPHAGYQFSGPCQAWAYKALAETRFPKRYILIGPDHNGFNSATSTCLDDWETPFGIVKSDKSFIIDLLDKCSFIKKAEKINEHSIEVQLPFLQYANKDKMKEIKIVPLIVPNEKDYMKIGEALAELGGEDTCVIVSSDFTHYGPSFNYVPFNYNIKEEMYALDKKAIAIIQDLDSKNFLGYVRDSGATICGKNAIALGMEVFKEWFSKKIELLSYYTSGDLTNYSNAVGYAAITFKS
ncbi:AmmeMemoRadiSam system protein B [Candidatus Woesearchaeota archaeon]|nr:AmmeMemoRadiSam system protein B [Candidatus Woesearchaeota archaeon]